MAAILPVILLAMTVSLSIDTIKRGTIIGQISATAAASSCLGVNAFSFPVVAGGRNRGRAHGHFDSRGLDASLRTSSRMALCMSNDKNDDNDNSVTTDDHDNHNNNSNNNNKNHNNNNSNAQSPSNDEARQLFEKAKKLREEITNMEQSLDRKNINSSNSNNNAKYIPSSLTSSVNKNPKSPLYNKRVMVVGANGRLGSMVTRYLLRQHPEVKEVVAAVHYVGDATTRGYGRLSYEVGAEDGRGTIGPAWSSLNDDESNGNTNANAYFEYEEETMKDYNLNKLRVVPVELLDPKQCVTLTEGVDSVIWCATDFDGNRPRAIASLNLAFLFRAVADPTKGRVEIEGLVNVLGGLKQSKQEEVWRNRKMSRSEGGVVGAVGSAGAGAGGSAGTGDAVGLPPSFVLVSTAPEAWGNFETPFGEFNGLKRQGEQIVRDDFPSLTHVILQMSRYDDNFVEESLELKYDCEEGNEEKGNGMTVGMQEKSKRRINRRDAARAAVEALTHEKFLDETVQVWTATVAR